MTFDGCCTPLRIMPPMIAYVCVTHTHVGLSFRVAGWQGLRVCVHAQVHVRTRRARGVRVVRARVRPTPGHHPHRSLHAIIALDYTLQD